MQVMVSGLFVEPAARRAVELVPQAQEWQPDIVVHEESELAGALAAAYTGARPVVHGLGLVSPAHICEATSAPGFERLCRTWRVPELAKGIRSAIYLDICPPSLRTDGELAWQRIQQLRPVAGEPARRGAARGFRRTPVPADNPPDAGHALPRGAWGARDRDRRPARAAVHR